MYPPKVLTLDTPEPELQGNTYGDLATWAIDLRAALRKSNTDKKDIRKWRDAGEGKEVDK